MEELELKALAVIRTCLNYEPVVSFSGGKDSLVALDLAIRAGVRRAVFCDTTMMFKRTLEYLNRIADFYGIEIDIVKAPRNLFELLPVVGPPSRRLRWCCEVFKFAPMNQYAVKQGIGAFIRGIRRQESHRRSKYPYISRSPFASTLQINPILDWSEDDVWAYIDRYSLPVNPLYKLGLKRIGCWPCPFKTKSDWKLTEHFFPELMERLRRELLEYARKVGIKDMEKFVDRRSWTSWATPQSKVQAGYLKKLSGNPEKDPKFLITLHDPGHMERVLELLPIISKSYSTLGNKEILVNLQKERNLRKLKILIEKAVNCVGCGACLTTCEFDALALTNGHITVDGQRCMNCLNCLKCSPFRGACIVRNYAPRKFEISEKNFE